MRQYLGWWNYQTKLPAWFAEGLAVYVSGGGGAEKIERLQAEQAFRSGRHFVPSGSGRLLFRETASSYDLTPHMFYRQSSMFVEWLHDLSCEHFERMIGQLRDGHTLNEAMLSSYGITVHDGWTQYLAELQAHLRAYRQ